MSLNPFDRSKTYTSGFYPNPYYPNRRMSPHNDDALFAPKPISDHGYGHGNVDHSATTQPGVLGEHPEDKTWYGKIDNKKTKVGKRFIQKVSKLFGGKKNIRTNYEEDVETNRRSNHHGRAAETTGTMI